MKKIAWTALIALSAVAAALAAAQTTPILSTVFLDQLSVRMTPSNPELVGVVGGKIVPVLLGGGVTISTTGANPQLLVTAAAPTPIPEQFAFATTPTTATLTLKDAPPVGSLLLVTRNGLLLASGPDYTLSGSTVTLNAAQTPQAGDLFQVIHF